jgi:hypothetical protein
MTKFIESLFVLIATYTPLLPIIIFLLLFKYSKREFALCIVIVYSIVEFTINSIAYYTTNTPIFLYPLFTIIEYSLFAILLYLFLKNPTVRIVILASIGLFIIFSTAYYFAVKGQVLDTVPIGIETVLILAYCFFFLYEGMQNDSQEFIYHRYSFWIVSGILIYLGGSSFIYLFANQFDKKTMRSFWTFQNAFSIIKNILFAISLYIHYKNNVAKSNNKNYRYEF